MGGGFSGKKSPPQDHHIFLKVLNVWPWNFFWRNLCIFVEVENFFQAFLQALAILQAFQKKSLFFQLFGKPEILRAEIFCWKKFFSWRKYIDSTSWFEGRLVLTLSTFREIVFQSQWTPKKRTFQILDFQPSLSNKF